MYLQFENSQVVQKGIIVKNIFTGLYDFTMSFPKNLHCMEYRVNTFLNYKAKGVLLSTLLHPFFSPHKKTMQQSI